MSWVNRRNKPLDEALRELLPADRRTDLEVLKELYALLGILDSKTSALLTFDALVVAIFTIIMGQSGVAGVLLNFCFAGTALIVVSMAICVWVVRMDWPFLMPGRVPAAECAEVATVVDRRTHLYQLAWFLSFAGVIMLVVALVLRYGV
jgi:hypothetical protein